MIFSSLLKFLLCSSILPTIEHFYDHYWEFFFWEVSLLCFAQFFFLRFCQFLFL